MSSDLPRYTLRIPRELLDRISNIAQYNGRSTNKEIEILIRNYVENFQQDNDKSTSHD